MASPLLATWLCLFSSALKSGIICQIEEFTFLSKETHLVFQNCFWKKPGLNSALNWSTIHNACFSFRKIRDLLSFSSPWKQACPTSLGPRRPCSMGSIASKKSTFNHWNVEGKIFGKLNYFTQHKQWIFTPQWSQEKSLYLQIYERVRSK